MSESDRSGRWIELGDICGRLSKVATERPQDVMRDSVSDFGDIYLLATTETKFTKAIVRAPAEDLADLLRVSCLFNDLTFFSPLGHPIQLYVHHLDPRVASSAQLRLPPKMMQLLQSHNAVPSWQPILVTGRDPRITQWMPDAASLIRSRRLLPFPSRAMMVEVQRGDEVRHEIWPASALAPIDQWTFGDSSEEPLVWTTRERSVGGPLIQLTLPFLRGIRFTDLDKLIDDEHDILSGLRSKLREIARSMKELPKQLWSEYATDTIQPSIDRLERTLRLVSQRRRLSLEGIALGAVTATYCAISVGAIEQIVTVGGAALAAAGKVISDHQAAMAETRNDPFYFLCQVKSHAEKSQQ